MHWLLLVESVDSILVIADSPAVVLLIALEIHTKDWETVRAAS